MIDPVDAKRRKPSSAVAPLIPNSSVTRRLLSLALCGIGSCLLIATAGASPVMAQVPGSTLSVLKRSIALSPADDNQVIDVAVSIQPRDMAGLQAFADSVSDPRLPTYLQFITPREVGERFGAKLEDVLAVKDYLASKGMVVTLVADNRMAVLARSTVAQARAAFGTQIKMYQGPDPEGRSKITFRANSGPLMLPAALAKVVIDISGVENYTRPKRRANTSLLTPFLTRNLYHSQTQFLQGLRGQGQNIAVTNFDGYRLSNIPLYVSRYNLPIPTGGVGTNITVVPAGTQSGPGSPGAEGDLDIQMELGMAPLANIYIYDGSVLVTVLTKEVNDNLADIISESYGWNLNSSQATAAHNQHVSMTAQGITYMAASGDSGTNMEPWSYPDYEPEVLQIGGTTATVNTSTGARVSEVAWSGSGGGYSTNTASFNVRPSWQTGTGVPTNINKRLVPDISYHSAGTTTGAYEFFYNGGLQTGFDGTSFASPICTGGLAIVEQRLFAARNRPPGGGRWRLGRLQDRIYQMNGKPSVFIDITSGHNGNLPNGQPSNGTVGWDTVTGWGIMDWDGYYLSFFGSR